jgi:hypothetical protein
VFALSSELSFHVFWNFFLGNLIVQWCDGNNRGNEWSDKWCDVCDLASLSVDKESGVRNGVMFLPVLASLLTTVSEWLDPWFKILAC